MPKITDPKGPTINAPVPVPEQVNHATSSVYLNRHFKNHMVSRIEGDSWVGTYYSKFHGNDDVVSSDADSDDPTLIQYMKVMDLELRVTSELNAQFNEESGTMTITGSANVYPIMIPTVGDVWVAPSGEGRLSIFSVTASRPLSYFKEAAYAIDYALVDETASDEELATLDEKVVETVYFDLARMEERGGPLLTESEYNRGIDKERVKTDLIEAYTAKFYDRLSQTFKEPGSSTYDPHLIEFWHKVVEIDETPRGRYPRLHDKRHGSIKTDYYTVFDVLLKNSKALFNSSMVKSMNRVSTTGYGGVWIYHALNTSIFLNALQPVLEAGIPSLEFKLDDNGDPLPYVFSVNFYNSATELMTPFERLVYQVIDGLKVIDYAELKEAAEDLLDFTADTTTLFYHMPFFLALLKIAR